MRDRAQTNSRVIATLQQLLEPMTKVELLKHLNMKTFLFSFICLSLIGFSKQILKNLMIYLFGGGL